MSLRINTNVASLQAQRQLNATTRALSRALERLSSGKRVNAARDNASALALSENLDSQVRGYRAAARGMNEAYGFLNTADSVLATQTELVQRMRELATQSASGTLSVTERKHLDVEFQTLFREFERVANQANYNGGNLLDGSFSTVSLQASSMKGDQISFSLGDARGSATFASSNWDGTYALDSSTTVNASGSYNGVKLADLNGDGISDLISGYNQGLTVSLGDGTGGFTPSYTFSNAFVGFSQIIVQDFTGDGNMDILAPNAINSDVRLFAGAGDGTFTISTVQSANGSSGELIVNDFNNDGHQDFVSTSATGSNYGVRLGLGTGTFEIGTTVSGYAVNGGDSADVDGDRNVDLVLFNRSLNEITVRRGNGAGEFATVQTYSLGAVDVTDLKLTDLDQDGRIDMVVSTGSSLEVYRGAGDGTFSLHSTTIATNTGSGAPLEIADLDGDGNLDILRAARATNLVDVFLGNGSLGFSLQQNLNIAGTALSSVAGDINADGIIDLIATTLSDSQVKTFLGGVEFSFQQAGFEISDQEKAQDLLEILDGGIQRLVAQRSQIGSMQNRLEYAISTALLTTENLAQARSQIVDTDIAGESAELVRSQILQQAAVSVLGQANLSLRAVLSLLDFN